ncbi:MAG: hypothetical protein KGJ50_05580 [Xanthomonadaceae bacterium]|nr:hypothetical protein [Xanthomonadaceae bacterium]
MRLSAAAFRRLLALALLAWTGMVFASPLPAVQAATAMAHAAVMLHAGQPMAAHCADASAAGYGCCGHAHPACSSGYCCGCVSVCGAVALPVAALSMRTSRAGRDLLRLRRPALAPMVTAPPLRPPAA